MNKIRKIASSGLFLAFCIVYSIFVAYSVIVNGQFPIFRILFVIAVWILFSAAKSGKELNFGFLHGIVKAKIILSWIAIGFTALGFVIVSCMIPLSGSIVSGIAEKGNGISDFITNKIDDFDIKDINSTIKDFDVPEGVEIVENGSFYVGTFNGQTYITVGGKNLSEILEMRSDGLYINGKRFDSDFLKDAKTKDTLTVIFMVCFLVLAIGLFIGILCDILYILLYLRKGKKFFGKLCDGELNIKLLRALRGWILAFAILSAIGAFGNLMGGGDIIGSGTNCASLFILYTLAGNLITLANMPDAPAVDFGDGNAPIETTAEPVDDGLEKPEE